MEKLLTQKQYEITTKKGAEATDSCTLDQVREPVSPLNIVEQPDRRLGMVRAEVLCGRSGSHLGHVFDDGPLPTGERYCISGCALKFMPEGKW